LECLGDALSAIDDAIRALRGELDQGLNATGNTVTPALLGLSEAVDALLNARARLEDIMSVSRVGA
jgi:hypothetical protein